MREINFSDTTHTILQFLADKQGIRVSDLIYKIVYEALKKKPYKFKNKKIRTYYFDPVNVYEDLGKELDKKLDTEELKIYGLNMRSRKTVIRLLVKEFIGDQELILSKKYRHQNLIPNQVKSKGGKRKLSKVEKQNSTFDIEGKVKKSPEFIPIQ